MKFYLLIVFVASFAASFLFSGMEAGALAINRLRIRQLARKGNPNAAVLSSFLDTPERLLWTILVGNTLATLTAVTLMVNVLFDFIWHKPIWFWIGMAGTVFFIYAICDLLPKMMFRAFPNRLCLLFAKPFAFFARLLSPLVFILQWLATGLAHWSGASVSGTLFGNRDEMRLVMQESAQNLSSEERTMITRVLELQNIPVGKIAIPLDQVISVNTKTPMKEVLVLCQEHKLNRLPVYAEVGSQRRIAGIISLRTVLYRHNMQPDDLAERYLKPALYLDEDTRLETALTRLQRSGERLAIVLARDKREIGLVSLQDILRTVFGDVSI
jgi:CBS domain containing-hemolysin-like protein